MIGRGLVIVEHMSKGVVGGEFNIVSLSEPGSENCACRELSQTQRKAHATRMSLQPRHSPSNEKSST